MTWDQTSLSPENFNILLKARLIPVTLVKAFLGWNTKAHMCEHETLSVPVCMCRMVHQCRIRQFHLPAFSCWEFCLLHPCQLSEEHYHNLKYVFGSSKPAALIAQTIAFYLPLGVTFVYCTSLWGTIIVLVANTYNSNPLSHHWYHNLVLVGFGEWGWTGENKPKVSVIAWVSETGRLKEVEIFISGAIIQVLLRSNHICQVDPWAVTNLFH